MWYVRKERQFRICVFFSAAALAGAFGGVLAWSIAHMDGVGGEEGWRWVCGYKRLFGRLCHDDGDRSDRSSTWRAS